MNKVYSSKCPSLVKEVLYPQGTVVEQSCGCVYILSKDHYEGDSITGTLLHRCKNMYYKLGKHEAFEMPLNTCKKVDATICIQE